MYECPPFDGYGPEEDVDSYPKDDIQKYPYRVSKERRNAIFQKKGKNLLRVTSPQHTFNYPHLVLIYYAFHKQITLIKISFMEQLP